MGGRVRRSSRLLEKKDNKGTLNIVFRERERGYAIGVVASALSCMSLAFKCVMDTGQGCDNLAITVYITKVSQVPKYQPLNREGEQPR